MKPPHRARHALVSKLVPILLAGSLLAGCGAGHVPDPAQPRYVPHGGVDGRTGSIIVDDIWIDAPHGAAAGKDASLRLDLSNEAGTKDALVGVSTPITKRVTLRRAGEPVHRIALPAHSSTDLEWANGVRLDRLRRAILPGRSLRVTLWFARAAPLTVSVPVGPIGTEHTTSANRNT